MRELDEVLVGTLDDGDRALAGERLGVDGVAVLTGRIRARRARRHVLQAVVALPVAAAVVVGAVALADRVGTPLPEATQPTEPSPTQSSTPEPTASPTPTAELVPLPDEPGLPPRFAAPDGILDRAQPGWVLAAYVPAGADQPATEAVLVLASPDGEAFELTRLALADLSGDGLRVVDWVAGSTHALLAATQDGTDATLLDLDLTTGEHRPATEDQGTTIVVARDDLTVRYDPVAHELVLDTAAGRARFGPFGLGAVDPSPDGRHVLADTTVVDTRTGDPVAEIQGLRADGWCYPLTWWTADQVLASCTAQDPTGWEGPYLDLDPRLVALPLASAADADQPGTPVRTLAAGDPVLYAWYPTWVADGEVVLQGTTLRPDTTLLGDLCPDGAYLVRADGSVAALPTAQPSRDVTGFLSRAVDGRVLTQEVGGCVYDSPPGPLLSYDPRSGAQGTVIGQLVGGVDAEGTRASWVIGR